MDNNANVPYAVYEGSQARQERTVKRLIAVIIVLIIALVGSICFNYFNNRKWIENNDKWIDAWQSYDYTSEETNIEYSQDGAGLNNINTGSQGDVNGAETESNDKTKNTP